MRSFKSLFRLNRFVFFLNLAILTLLLGFSFRPLLNYLSGSKEIEVNRMIVRGKNGAPTIVLQGDEENTLLTLHDREGNVRLQLQGGDFPSLMLKNNMGEVMGTLFPLKEGGSALGLANEQGEVAALFRGGSSPGLGLYSHSQIPQVALGIAESVPHFLLFPIANSEGMVMDGSSSTSLLFFDANGQIPVALSRYGLYQNENVEEKTEGQSADIRRQLSKQLRVETLLSAFDSTNLCRVKGQQTAISPPSSDGKPPL